MKFTFVASQRTLEFLLACTARERQTVAKLLEGLTTSPDQPGDYQEADETGRELQVKSVRPFLVWWWVDPWAKEVRVTRVEKLELR